MKLQSEVDKLLSKDAPEKKEHFFFIKASPENILHFVSFEILPHLACATFRVTSLGVPFKWKRIFTFMQFTQNGKRSLDRISVDRNCALSLDRNYVNHLIEFFDTFHLIELFDQLIKKN